MIDRHRDHRTAPLPNESRNKTVHVIKRRQIKKIFPGKHLDPAATIWSVIAQQSAADCIGQTRGKPPPSVVLTLEPPSIDETRPWRFFFPVVDCHELRYVAGIVLAISVKGCNQRISGCLNAAAHGHALAALLVMTDNPQPGVFCAAVFQNFQGSVCGVVVDADNFYLFPAPQCFFKFVKKWLHIIFFVQYRDHY